MSELQNIADTLIGEMGVEGAVEYLLLEASKEDSPEGFGAFFEYLHGIPLHSEGEKWIRNAYDAHSKNMGLAQECHRESGKTTVFSKFFLAFRIGQEPHKTNAIIRINGTKARETAEGVASIIESDPRWKKVFPHVVPDPERGWGQEGYYVKRADLDYEDWQKVRTQQPDDPTFVGYGYDSGSIIGSRFSGVVIVDDIHNDQNTRSRTELKKVKVFVTDTLEYCRMENAWEIWNFTPWTLNDMYAWIKSTGEYIVSKSPVFVEATETTPGAEFWEEMPLNRQKPELGNIPISGKWYKRYDPVRWSFERIAQKYRKTGAIGFARMMMLDLEATKGMLLKDEWLLTFQRANIQPTWTTYMGVDYAAKEPGKEGGDFFALAVYAAIPEGGLVGPIDGYRGHLTKAEALHKVWQFYQKHPRTLMIGVESIGEGRGFYNDLVMMRDVQGALPLKKLSAGDIGTKRIDHPKNRFVQYLAPKYQMGRVLRPDTWCEFGRHFYDEWLLYPGQHDDCLDACHHAVMVGEGALIDRTKSYKSGTINGEKENKRSSPFAAFGKRRR